MMTPDELAKVSKTLDEAADRHRTARVLFIASLVEHVKIAEYEAADLRRHAALMALGLDPLRSYSR